MRIRRACCRTGLTIRRRGGDITLDLGCSLSTDKNSLLRGSEGASAWIRGYEKIEGDAALTNLLLNRLPCVGGFLRGL